MITRTTVWLVSDIQQIASTLVTVNPDPRFQAGVLALANALGALPAVRPTNSQVRRMTDGLVDHNQEGWQ